MTDIISRQAAIDALISEGRNVDSRYLESERIIHESDAVEAISMLPSAQPEQLVNESGSLVKGLVKDCIDRQDAIDALNICYANIELYHDRPVNCYEGMFYTAIKMALDRLPSAQPYTEEQLQKLQDLEQAQLEEAYRRGYEEGKSEIILCKDCKRFIDHRCVKADHHVSKLENCMEVFGAEREEE